MKRPAASSAGSKRTKTPAPAIDPAEAQAIAWGHHDDPFSVLGIHHLGDRLVIRAYAPEAESVAVLIRDNGKHVVDLAPVEDAWGVFAAAVPRRKERFAYRLQMRRGDSEWQVDDPYRFGPVLGELDEYLMGEGLHRQLWDALGAHVMEHEGVTGTHFAVWAPSARRVAVAGDFNYWDTRCYTMRRRGSTGVWEIFIPDIGEGARYKYEVTSPDGNVMPLKADPVAFGSEHPPAAASVVRRLEDRAWRDGKWMARRAEAQRFDRPISIYEVHLGSWMRVPEHDGRMLSYHELAERLVPYARDMGFTHLELLPISEYPFEGSWGYQPIGLYAPTIRHGTPEEFRDFVEACHDAGLGVIIDWVPGHFPTDEHGLGRFDGTALYEHADPKEGFHPDWNTLVYNYGRREVSNYLIANGLYWLKEYHIDGLRVDAVASMLYRDYSRAEGQWVPNLFGGRENLEAIEFLRHMNSVVYGEVPGIATFAEESTAWPGVSRPTNEGGLGFGFKWNMGWMNDTLDYMKRDPIHRRHHHYQMTFGLMYAFSENFILPLSHDEVVHGKRSLLDKMPGSGGVKFANLRAYYGFMWTQPGKKLLFMGGEIAQGREWNHDDSLDWHLLDCHWHKGVQSLVRDLNWLYRDNRALHVKDCEGGGFEWIEPNDAEESIYAYLRFGHPGDPPMLMVCNFTPVMRESWRVGLPFRGPWTEVLNSDATDYGGEGRGQNGTITGEDMPWHRRPHSATISIPPLATVIFRLSEGG